ncbi:MAG: helix-turn-helix domain-containing protein [bacterium]
MAKQAITKLIKQPESGIFEKKSSLSDIKRIVEVVCSFANSNGGKVLVGVSDKGKVMNIDIGKNTIERLTDTIIDNTDHKIYPEISTIKTDEKNLILISVKPSPQKPHTAYGRAYKRAGKNTKLMSQSEYERLLLEKNKDKMQFDAFECKGAKMADIDKGKVKWFLKKAKAERNFDVEPEIPVNEALERLGLMKNKKLTNAAILLFGKNPQKFFLQARIRCARFKGVIETDFIDMKIIEGNIIDQVDEAEKFILTHIKKAAKVVMFKREEMWEYPPDALREAIVNAVAHRDYECPGNIKVAVLDDRVEITDPGTLPAPLTAKMLKQKHDSVPRNKLISEAFFLIKNIEQWGKGTNKMVEWCVEQGLKEPDFEEIGGGFMVKFYAPEDLLSLIPEKDRIDLKQLGLNKRQIEALALMLNENRVFTNKTYRERFKVSNQTCVRDMKLLNKLDLAIIEGKGKNVKYKAK